MVKRYLFFLSLFVSIVCQAQSGEDSTVIDKDSVIIDTFSFDIKFYKGKGELTFISQQSKSTGGTYQISLPTGEWQYFDNNEVLRIKGNYKVKGTQSNKSGRWEYYDDEGELLMTENFPPLKYSVVYLKPFAIRKDDGFDIINYNGEDVLEKKEYTPPAPPTAISSTYRINFSNDSMTNVNYDTIINMDNRNSDTWLLADSKSKTIDEELNLVENGSFEKDDKKLSGYGETIGRHINDWVPSAGTPDYYNYRKFNALDGHAAIGARFYTQEGSHIEFISTQLKESLEANKTYCLKVYVRLKEDCFFWCKCFGCIVE
jgi:hypothetical protein